MPGGRDPPGKLKKQFEMEQERETLKCYARGGADEGTYISSPLPIGSVPETRA